MCTFVDILNLWLPPSYMMNMMTSSNGNIFRVTGHLCGEFTDHRWIPCTKASDAELWCFLNPRLSKWLNKQSPGWWFETLSRLLLRHRKKNAHLCDVHYLPLLYNTWCMQLKIARLPVYIIKQNAIFATEGAISCDESSSPMCIFNAGGWSGFQPDTFGTPASRW